MSERCEHGILWSDVCPKCTTGARRTRIAGLDRQLAEAQGKLKAVEQWRYGLVNEPPWNMDTLDRILGGEGD